MEPRLTIVTLGVSDIARSRAFYEKLGWKPSPASQGDITFFKAGGVVLSIFPREHLAEDAKVDAQGSGFRGFTLAHNVKSKDDVAKVLAEAEKAGARILKPAQDVFWGGHSGYFADPDGNLWEVAWNPHVGFKADGTLDFP